MMMKPSSVSGTLFMNSALGPRGVRRLLRDERSGPSSGGEVRECQVQRLAMDLVRQGILGWNTVTRSVTLPYNTYMRRYIATYAVDFG